jgi:hypothetical protein
VKKNPEIEQLLAEMEALPSYCGWQFTYEYPGFFCYSHPSSPASVCFTPDWDRDGEVQIEVQTLDGRFLGGALIPWPHEGRTAQKLFDLVKPYLDEHQPAGGGDEPEEQCGQCGAVILGCHACQGVPGGFSEED